MIQSYKQNTQLQDKYETRLDVPREEWDQLVEEIDQRAQNPKTP